METQQTQDKASENVAPSPEKEKEAHSPSIHHNGYCQLSHQTREERFPKIFNRLKYLKANAKRILSFGCSTGEECFAIAKRFPNAEIIGLDIDYYTIKRARDKNPFKNRVFFHTEIGGTGKYDIVTALMTLFSLQNPVPKENWDDAISKIDKHLNPGGLLVIYTSDYDLEETEIGKNYITIHSWRRVHNKNSKEYYCGYYYKKRSSVLLPISERQRAK